jgi:hypothetical protein
LDARSVGKHHAKQHDTDTMLPHEPIGLFAGGRSLSDQAVGLKQMRQTIDQTGVRIDDKRKHGRQPAQRSDNRLTEPERRIEIENLIISTADISHSEFSPSDI